MRNQPLFFRISSAAALLALVALSAANIGSANASPSAQAATPAATMPVATMSAATMSSDSAIPPCPAGMAAPTMAAAAGTPAMAATTSMMAPTMAATTSMMTAPTMAATTSMMAPTMAATMYVMPGATMSGCTLTAALLGTNEVPKAGDPNGKGTATLMLSRPATGPGEICFNIQVSGIKLPATASHIHSGATGVAGPVVVPFQAPDASGNTLGCTENVDRALIAAILSQPANYYVNVHNADFPGGAMRGQLGASGQ